MFTEVKVPAFPESVTDGVVAAWHKRDGDSVREGEALVDVETDKVLFEVSAPASGRLREVSQPQGATVVAGQLLARIESEVVEDAPSAVRNEPAPTAMRADVPINPAARRFLQAHDIAAETVQGSGRDGRVLKEDAARVISAQSAENKAKNAPSSAMVRPEPAAREPAAHLSPALTANICAETRPERRVAMTRLRARIAERLIEAQRTAAILTTFNEVNMQAVIALRQTHRQRFEQAHGVKLGFMSFFVKAVVEALKRYPLINASIEGSDIVYHDFFDIGIAVSSPRGLVVPVLRDADRCSIAEIERQIAAFADKARAGTLSLEEISGGTFTITNGGVFGSLLSTPILNPPQSAILGMHRIEERAVVEGGVIVARPMMYVALSYDHRLIDGKDAVQFLVTVKELLEDPARMLLEI
ncbi:MAG: 2-oxoglutarate dehydrogenase complex dihydrolipoyllysine-residue succinyltransferase [Chromatiales bacterium]|jgi:2-oxoglutarate dehydrogenase E2 component (dihydrolipoamide succinyltransferase)|nr:2-oxoglutarate dehydrogenase complex dihydrolipoyllysine-residue succinyltransferase [Chromatiales bacterium]